MPGYAEHRRALHHGPWQTRTRLVSMLVPVMIVLVVVDCRTAQLRRARSVLHVDERG